VSGTWRTTQAPGNYLPSFSFQQSGTNLRGTATLTAAEQGRANYSSPSGPVTGTIAGDQLEVYVTWTRADGSSLQGRYAGTVGPGSSRGQGQIQGSAGGQTWTANGPLQCAGSG
jgi:hypothetical protein